MKATIRTIILSAVAIFAVMSCQKEESVPGAQDKVNAGETILVSIDASLGDLAAADVTKATAESVVRLKWEGDDSNPEYVKAYCGTQEISTGNGLKVTPSANGLSAKLTGEITTNGLSSGASVITFVHSSGCKAEGLTFDFSSQNDSIPFVAYGTLVYDGAATLTDKIVEFKFATSVMKIAATGLGGGKISGATIGGINTKVTLTPKADSETCDIAGRDTATIAKTAGIAASSDSIRAIITVGLVPDTTSTPYRMLTVSQASYTNKGVITSAEIESGTSYTTPASLFTCGTLGKEEKAHDYVLIAGTKWATKNIGATDSDPYGTYFMWGYTDGHSVDSDGTFKNQTFKKIDRGEDIRGFDWVNYINFTSATYDRHNNRKVFTEYVPSDGASEYGKDGTFFDDKTILDLKDDAARVKWGSKWRMPTLAEFQALSNATYWKWDGTDKGYYVYAPQPGDAGKVNSKSMVADSYDKSSALLFFPAAGRGDGKSRHNANARGFYWLSTLDSFHPASAYCLTFYDGLVSLQVSGERYTGYSVRPVSD